jgi:site-specific recombinase XerD
MAASSADRYADAVRKFLAWMRGTKHIQSIEHAPRNTLVLYCSGLVEAGYMPATVHMQMAAVNRYIKWLGQQDVNLPAFHRPDLPKNPIRMKDILEPDQLSTFFRLADEELEEPVRSAVMLLPCSGLRSGELAELPLSSIRRVSIDLADGHKTHALALVVRGKGGDERVVPLLNEGAQILAGYLAGWRRSHPDVQWLFPGRYDSHIATRSLRSALQRIREPIQMVFTPHTMRRTYLTGLYRRGVKAEVLVKIAGHKKIETLLTHYLALDGHFVTNAVHKAGSSLL